MDQISEIVWKNIIHNQKFPLFGTNIPNNGNGYNDAISWKQNFHFPRIIDTIYDSDFFTIYLRDLGLFINPNLSRKDKFKDGLSIINRSENYYQSFIKYFCFGNHHMNNDILRELGNWGENLSRNGMIIFEIIGWYDNDSNQFYAYELNNLDIEYCKIEKNNIIYNAPIKFENEKLIFRKIKIPKEKCIIIEFPEELGGFKNFKKKVEQIRKLGNKHNALNLDNPGENLKQLKNWEKKFNKIVSDWGSTNKFDEITEFYYILNALKFKQTSILCTIEIINGLQELIKYLNKKFNEEATVKLSIEEYEKDFYQKKINNWLNGDLSFEEANELLRN